MPIFVIHFSFSTFSIYDFVRREKIFVSTRKYVVTNGIDWSVEGSVSFLHTEGDEKEHRQTLVFVQ